MNFGQHAHTHKTQCILVHNTINGGSNKNASVYRGHLSQFALFAQRLNTFLFEAAQAIVARALGERRTVQATHPAQLFFIADDERYAWNAADVCKANHRFIHRKSNTTQNNTTTKKQN